jgi:integrase
MTRMIARTRQADNLTDVNTALFRAGRAANQAAMVNLFADFRTRKSANTLRTHDAALTLFAAYLGEAGVTVDADSLASDPAAWEGVTWGIVKGFVLWMTRAGYAVSSINSRLATVRSYADLAHQAGVIPDGEYLRIKAVSGYSRQEGARLDQNRDAADIPTRVGDKKAGPVTLTDDQAKALLSLPDDTPQGRRDCLLVHLLLVHGLRVSELAALQVGSVTLNGDAGTLEFYRPKLAGTDQERGRHTLKNGTLAAMREYLERDAAKDPEALLFRKSDRSGRLLGEGMTTRRLSARVKVLGERVGVEGLTAHDCRHFAATKQAEKGVRHLLDAFGWTSASTAMRYVRAADIVEVE